jgi:FecR protein
MLVDYPLSMTKISFLFLFLSLPLFAQDFTFDKEKGQAIPNFLGQLKLMKGQVYKKSGDDLVEVKTGERFNKNDTIVTGEKSIAKVLVVDDTMITIGPSSELNFENFEFTDKTNRKALFNLIKGQVSGNIRNKAKDNDLQFKTKYTILGVRGTEILMNFRKVNAMEISEYALLSGKAEITDEQNGKKQILKGDHVVFIHKDGSSFGQGNLKLSPEELKRLQAPKIDETKDFKPVMPYYEPTGNDFQKVVQASAQEEVEVNEDGKRDDKKHWKDNLNELNKKLKENSKKR